MASVLAAVHQIPNAIRRIGQHQIHLRQLRKDFSAISMEYRHRVVLVVRLHIKSTPTHDITVAIDVFHVLAMRWVGENGFIGVGMGEIDVRISFLPDRVMEQGVNADVESDDQTGYEGDNGKDVGHHSLSLQWSG